MMVCGASEPGCSRQFIATMVVNLAAMSYGTMMGWTSPMTPRLQSGNSPIGPPDGQGMTDEEASWLTAALCLGGILGSSLAGFLGEKFSRKTMGVLTGLPIAACWLVTLVASSHFQLFVGRFLGGVGAGGCLILVPLYVREISRDNIRGMLGSLLILFLNAGILLAYVLGTFLSFHLFAGCALLLPLFYIGGFLFLPESPVYLVRQNRLIEATRALAWLRANDEATIQREIELLHAQAKENALSKKPTRISDLFKDRATIKGLIIVLGLFIGQQLSGIFAMISYTETIFHISGSSLTPNAAAITVASMQLFGSYLSTSLMERTGRRFLLILSCAGMSVSHYALGTFCFLQSRHYQLSSLSWLPIISLSLFVILFNVGMGPAPYVIGSEIFSREIAGFALTVSLLSTWTIAFIVVKSFADLILTLEIYGCFFLLGSFCVCNLIFIVLFVPETKGRTLEAIVNELNGTSYDLERAQEWVSTIHQSNIQRNKNEFL